MRKTILVLLLTIIYFILFKFNIVRIVQESYILSAFTISLLIAIIVYEINVFLDRKDK